MTIRRKTNGKYEVRYHRGNARPARTFDRKGDAEVFDTEMTRRRQLGSLAAGVVQSKQTLSDFIEEEWWPRHAEIQAEDTQRRYLEILGTHLLPVLGDYPLEQIDAMAVEDFRAAMVKRKVGTPSQAKALWMLQGIMQRATRRRLIPENPVKDVPKPKQRTTKPKSPLAPATVERIRDHMLAMWSSEKRGSGRSAEELRWWRSRNATMVSMFAYAGVRPVEGCASRWADISGRTLHVVASKNNKARDVTLLAPLAQDLAEWRMICGRPAGGELIFPTYDGDEWVRHDWNNWRKRVYQQAAVAAGVTGDLTPYRLRGSFVSLLLWEGRSLGYVAKQAGHTLRTLDEHYAGVIEELEYAERVPAEEAIRRARVELADAELTGKQIKETSG